MPVWWWWWGGGSKDSYLKMMENIKVIYKVTQNESTEEKIDSDTKIKGFSHWFQISFLNVF